MVVNEADLIKSKDDIWEDILSEYIYIIDDFIFT